MVRLGNARLSFHVLAALGAPLAAQTTLVSASFNGNVGNQRSWDPAVSGDGRFVAFFSLANNLIANDTSVNSDIFLRDRTKGTTSQVSVSTSGVHANNDCARPCISPDGRFVAFDSKATNLAPGMSLFLYNVFVRDLQAGTTTLASPPMSGTQANGDSLEPSLSDDGRFVAFASSASNLVPGDTNAKLDVFVRDLLLGTTVRVSVTSAGLQANNASLLPSISADGSLVAFYSTAALTPNSTGSDVFVHALGGATELVSVDLSGTSGAGGTAGNGGRSLSADGRFVAFWSPSSNLVANDTNGRLDVFVRDRMLGITTRVSVASSGAESDGRSGYDSLAISRDGQWVVFESEGTNLVPGDTNGQTDVFVHGLASGETTLVSVASNGTQGNFGSGDVPGGASISAHGTTVAFESTASTLVPLDGNGVHDVFAHDLYPPSTVYCTAGTSSSGCVASIASSGTASLSAGSGFVVSSSNVEAQRDGIFFYGIHGTQSVPWANGSSSSLCVAPPLQRTLPQSSGGSSSTCQGAFAIDLLVFLSSSSGALGLPFVAGQTLELQTWYRDPPAPRSSNLSNALEVVLGF